MSTSKKILAVIPARLASQRLPEKPLKLIAGQTLVERVWNQASKVKLLSKVVVATDAPEIESEVKRFGGEVLMTSTELPSGSARVLASARILGDEVDSTLGEDCWDLVLNVQGDMPFIKPEVITKAVEFMLDNPQFEMGTIATPIFSEENFNSSSVVKVVVSEKGEGFYFSRAPIPHSRDGERMTDSQGRTVFGYKHIGLYVFRPEALRVYDDQTGLQLENIEKLEQIRALEMGYRIGVCVIPEELMEPAIEVDTPADLDRAEEIARGYD